MALGVRELVACYPGQKRRALDAVSFDVEPHRTLAIVGPSGAGKTTLLRIVAGLHHPLRGDVLIDNVSQRGVPPQERRAAVVFQDDALFANMTIRQNLGFAVRGSSKGRGARVTAAAAALHVGDRLDRRPAQLSGGERQRASIARALLSDPAVLLLDEPLAHLDPALKRSVRHEILGVRERFGGPVLYVTHDHVDAMSVGDLLAVLIDGRLEDIGEPQRVYDAPRSAAVARFLGERPMNLFEYEGALAGIRPERIRIDPGGALDGRVARSDRTGADRYLEIETERGPMIVRVPGDDGTQPGDRVALDLPAAWVRHFNANGAARW
ncbi:MAG TPA: ABC transporter ATP-binding protein [Candidatus Cybelea sp.]|nr:ABC transporter ATP-binding protein [Candidatus Cybelea sp.]